MWTARLVYGKEQAATLLRRIGRTDITLVRSGGDETDALHKAFADAHLVKRDDGGGQEHAQRAHARAPTPD